jgi:hypothetical protein
VPTNDRRGFDDEDAGPPVLPDGRQPDPLEPVSGRQFRPFRRPLKNAELMTEGDDLQLKSRTNLRLADRTNMVYRGTSAPLRKARSSKYELHCELDDAIVARVQSAITADVTRNLAEVSRRY